MTRLTVSSSCLALSLAVSNACAQEIDLTSEYASIKSLVQERLDPDVDAIECAKNTTRIDACENHEADCDPHMCGSTIVVFDCGFTDGIDGVFEGVTDQPEWSQHLLYAAKQVVSLEIAAREAGYPEGVWLKNLERYERAQIIEARRLLDQSPHRAVRDEYWVEPTDDPDDPHFIVDVTMSEYRKRVDPSLPQLQSQEGCGAGESPFVIMTSRPATRISLIPEFFSTLCRKTGRPPDGEACPYWFETSSEKELGLAGYYRYSVIWQDGTRTVGAVDVDRLALGASSEPAQLQIIHPQD